jgi:hypothetical protein
VEFAEDMPAELLSGMIVSVTGKVRARHDENGTVSLSSTMPTVTLTTKAMDKAIFGVLVSEGPLPEDHWHKEREGGRFGIVNALGEGRMWVSDLNGPIEAGDYVTSSNLPGYGQLQDDDIARNYTVAKAIETVDWDQVEETVEIDGRQAKIYLLAVVYISG